MIRQGAMARVSSTGINQELFTDGPNKDILIFDLMALYISVRSLRKLKDNYPKLTYEPILSLDGVSQVDKCFYCWAATGAGTGDYIFEIDALFEMKHESLSDALRWGHFGGGWPISDEVEERRILTPVAVVVVRHSEGRGRRIRHFIPSRAR